MASSLSNLFDNLAEGIYEIKCKGCNCFHEYESINQNLIKNKCLSWNKNYSNKLMKCQKRDSKTDLSFLKMISINLFCY